MNHRVWLFITDPSHCSPHAFGDLLGNPGRSCAIVCPRLIFFFLETKHPPHRFSLPFPDSVHSGTTSGSVFVSKAEDITNMFNHPSALLSPRHVFTSVNFRISPPSLVCGFTIHGTSKDLEKVLQRGTCGILSWSQLKGESSLRVPSTCSQQTCGLRFKILSSCANLVCVCVCVFLVLPHLKGAHSFFSSILVLLLTRSESGGDIKR